MDDLPPPIPAATLVLMRPGQAAEPELLMMERTGTMAFAAGAMVFPGGRIDDDDHASAARLGSGQGDAAARIAAIRETIEETGLAPCIVPEPDAAARQALRTGLKAGTPFANLLAASGLRLDLDALTPFARWCPNFRETRRFDATFYLAAAPAGGPDPEVDAGEGVRALWASASSILDEVEAGRAQVIFPTRRNLERLARFASVDAARADAAAHPVRTITPWVETRDERQWVCIPEDAGYPVTAELLETARRR